MTDNIRIFEVGGAVRDRFLGVPNKDLDYAVQAPSFDAMRQFIVEQGGEIFLETEQFLTIRARMGRDTADYVLCRKDGAYSDGRRPDTVSVGTIYDDLCRRDFTMNAIARDMQTDQILDPFEGRVDIRNRIIRCVGDVESRMAEDSLRLLRAMRFSITKGFYIYPDIQALFHEQMWAERVSACSEDRIRDEVSKMFRANTQASIAMFGRFPLMSQACFSGGVWLKPTSENR